MYQNQTVLVQSQFDIVALFGKGTWMETTDIVVKQTGRGGCLHTVEIQTEIQV